MSDDFNVIKEFYAIQENDEPNDTIAIGEKERFAFWEKIKRWGHQYLNDKAKWVPCPNCGDMADAPDQVKGGGYVSPEVIKNNCSKYGKYK